MNCLNNYNEILISIICPVYNASSFLKEAVDSVINQTFKNWELILIDDCSTDNSAAICEEYASVDKRVFVIKNIKNLGQGASRNKGLSVIRGHYVTFLDSDDYFDLYYLENVRLIIEKYHPDMISTNYKYFKGKKIKNIFLTTKEEKYESELIYAYYLNNKKIHSGAVGKFYQRSTIKNIYFPCFRAREDIYFLNNIFTLCKSVVLSPSFGYNVRLRENSTESKAFSEAKLDTLKSAELAIQNCKKFYPHLKKDSYSYAGHLYLKVLIDVIISNFYKQHPEVFENIVYKLNEYLPFLKDKKDYKQAMILKKSKKRFIVFCKMGIIR